MAVFKVLCVLLFVLTVSALASFNDELPEKRDNEDNGFDERQLALEQRLAPKKGVGSSSSTCLKKGEECSGFVLPCCGTQQCYWKNGYSMIQSGVCVECVQKGQLCQSDSQCCSGLVCHKEKWGYVNGGCDLPRSAGQPCHEDVQCASKNCRIGLWDQMVRNDGVCA